LNWKKRGAKLFSVFITGYGGGLGVLYHTNFSYTLEMDWLNLFISPLISGLIVLIPIIGKMFGEYSNGT